jgi:FAD/FMN-containing dehydrogenase
MQESGSDLARARNGNVELRMATHTLTDLRQRHRGPVIAPEDAGYDAARLTFNGMIDRRPELIARPLDVDDVVAAVSFARDADLPIAVRGGGHSVAGHCVGDGSLVVDLRLVRSVAVDPEARTATCGGGSLWEDFDPPCQRAGLATPGGTFGDTGVGGLTLGGGIGHLIGLYGLTLDNLLAATIVTAAGEVVAASEGENPELFWALRGGGGNFGVVVDFTFQLHPVGRLLGGALNYDLEDTEAVVAAWRDVIAAAPDSLALFAMVTRSALARARGEGALISVAYFGDLDEGRDAIRPLYDLVTPVADGVRPMYYAELQDIFGRSPFGLRNYWSGRFLRELPDEVIDYTASHFADPEATGSVLFEPIYGAAARVPPDATAFAGRDARYNATFTSAWTDPEDDERQVGWARSFSEALAPWAVGGGYVNYASESAGDGMETEYGGQRLRRLRDVKRRYDPENRFRFNHNISPGQAGSA